LQKSESDLLRSLLSFLRTQAAAAVEKGLPDSVFGNHGGTFPLPLWEKGNILFFYDFRGGKSKTEKKWARETTPLKGLMLKTNFCKQFKLPEKQCQLSMELF
jgi:hypothetical protein